MGRVTTAEVRKILDDTSLTAATIDEYIVSANAFVTDTLGGEGLGTAILKEIERWLVAHMISMTRERMAAKEGAGGASITYTGAFGEGLMATPYGQMAVGLDSSKTLETVAKGKTTARITAVTSFD